jgi:hypothetical protein
MEDDSPEDMPLDDDAVALDTDEELFAAQSKGSSITDGTSNT